MKCELCAEKYIDKVARDEHEQTMDECPTMRRKAGLFTKAAAWLRSRVRLWNFKRELERNRRERNAQAAKRAGDYDARTVIAQENARAEGGV